MCMESWTELIIRFFFSEAENIMISSIFQTVQGHPASIRKLSSGGEIGEKVNDTGLLGRLPGLALREMDVVLGMLLIG